MVQFKGGKKDGVSAPPISKTYDGGFRMNGIVPRYRKSVENWRPSPIDGDTFLVSDQGNVLRLIKDNGQVVGAVTPPAIRGKYLCVFISLRNRAFPIHRLVLEAFHSPPPHRGYQCNHRNGNKHDNRLENLEWATPSQNSIHAHRVLKASDPQKRNPRLKKPIVREIRTLLVSGLSYAEIEKRTGVRQKTIAAIHQRRIYYK
jgi:hypothetical protein